MEGFTTKKQQFATVWKMHTAGDAQWYPAQVPGTVYTDLLRNGQMEDPFWKDNEYRALDLMEKDYEYERISCVCISILRWSILKKLTKNSRHTEVKMRWMALCISAKHTACSDGTGVLICRMRESFVQYIC